MKNEKSVKSSVIKRETKLIVYVVACMVVIVMGSSYAFFFQVGKGTQNMVIKAGNLAFSYPTDKVRTIANVPNATCYQPKTLDAALASSDCGYNFSVTNVGNLASNYQLQLIANQNNTADINKLKVIVRKKNGDALEVMRDFPKDVSSLNNGILLTDAINTSDTVVYNVQVYLDSGLAKASDNGKTISYSIKGIGEVKEN